MKMFAFHYKTGEVLPEELHAKMLAAKNVGSGISTLYQIFYGMIDMTLHDQYKSHETRTTTDIVKDLQKKIILTPYIEGTHFEAAFGHLMGYASSYYGYLWSDVYAQDMFSIFQDKGVLNPEVGKRYRDIILAKGGTEEPIDLVKQFLEREPNPKAFYKSLGLEEEK
jgi:thimet oligopeptidase